jgi:hypothetical protein
MVYKMRNLFFILTLLPFTLAAQENVLESDDCVRSVPEPLMKKSKVTNWTFHLDTSTRTGHERAILDNSDTLRLENKGCEYFWVEFEFRFAHKIDTTEIEVVRQYLNKAHNIVDYRFSYCEAYKLLKEQAKIEMDKDYFLNDNEISEQFSLLQLDNSRIRFAFGIGPL